MEEENEPMLYLRDRGDGTFEPVLSGATHTDDIMWSRDVLDPKPVEVNVHWEGATKKLPAVQEQLGPDYPGVTLIRSSVAWRFINETRAAAQKGAGSPD